VSAVGTHHQGLGQLGAGHQRANAARRSEAGGWE
jgi:hypothetical protein